MYFMYFTYLFKNHYSSCSQPGGCDCIKGPAHIPVMKRSPHFPQKCLMRKECI